MPGKRFETRHFKPRPALPIDVAIHAAKRWSRDETDRISLWPFSEVLTRAGYSLRDPSKDYQFSGGREHNGTLAGRDGGSLKRLPLGAIIGVAKIVAVTPTHQLLASWGGFEDGAAERYAEEVRFGDYSDGRFGWELANAIELIQPIVFRGRQDVLYELPPDVDALIDEQLAKVSI
jgi:hypothetical protein